MEKDYKSYIVLLTDMDEGERRLFLQSETVVAEKSWLEQMLLTNKALGDRSKELAETAKQYVHDYELFKNAQFLDQAEFYSELALNLRLSKYTINDIRKQRERIQWEVRRMKELQKTIESKPSSKTSRSSDPSS